MFDIMGVESKPLRYAHAEGHTDVCYSEDGDRLVTCGADGDVRIWSSFDDGDPNQTCVGEWALVVCQKAGHLYASTDSNQIQILTFPDAERDGILARFAASINHVSVGRKHSLAAIGTEDTQVRVVDLSLTDNPSTTSSYEGSSGPVLSVALCPNGKLVAAASGDESLRIWDVDTKALLKTFKCAPKCNGFANATNLCRIDFDSVTGRSLAYPTTNSIIIVNTLDWSSKSVLMCAHVESSYSLARFSPCGNLMAAATVRGDVVIWDVYTHDVVGTVDHPQSIAICALAWNPTGNGEIAYCDVSGQLGLIVGCFNKFATPAIVGASELNNYENDSRFDTNFEEASSTKSYEDDEENENAISLEKLKNEIMADSNDGCIDDIRESVRSPSLRAASPVVPFQDVFMPSSTPEHLNPRYLCWNDIGVVRSYNCNASDDTNKSIEVEFHDTSFHNAIMIQNFHDYTMGSLSCSALTIANDTQVAIIPLGFTSKEWNVNLSDDDEAVVCVACSSNLIYIATANYRVRVYSVFGTQRAVFSVPGPPVSMAARGCSLLIAYHYASPRKDDQSVGVMNVKIKGISVESTYIPTALKPNAKLQWIGFSDLDTPAIQDSAGVLYLYPLASNVWIPFCDTTKIFQNGDGFFITSVFESSQAARGIRCRGSMYPSFIPRPVLIELPLLPPFLESATEKSQMEANLFTWSVLQVDNTEKKIKETALKTFALSCKNNLDQRALEFIETMANPQLLTIVTKYASKLNKVRLVEKLTELAAVLQEDEKIYVDNKNDALDTSITPSPIIGGGKSPGVNRLLLNSVKKRVLKPKDKSEVLTPSKSAFVEENDRGETTRSDNNDSIANTQESLFSECEPHNPFLKRIKDERANKNPLSLTDKNAGVNEEKKIEKRKSVVEPEFDNLKIKQRKLSAMFGKLS